MTTDTLINQYVDDAGDSISVWYNQKISDSLAFSDFKKAYAGLILNKFSSTTFLNAVMHRIDGIEVIYTVQNNEIVVVTAFEHNKEFNEVYIILSYVPPKHRNSFFTKARHLQDTTLKEISIDRGVTQMAGWVNVNNTKTLKVFERRGFVPECVKVVRQL